jgi:hypothetical protein
MTIVATNTTWKSGSVVNLTGEVQIAPGVVLTVEPGVTINANGQKITVYGTLKLAGTPSAPIKLDKAVVGFGSNSSTPGDIQFSWVEMTSGRLMAQSAYGSYGRFDLVDSTFTGVGGFYIWYPTGPSSVTRSVFDRSDGLSIGTNQSGTVSVTHSVFANQTGDAAAIKVWANYNNGVDASFNSFLSTDRVAIELPIGYSSAGLTASSNYFGTDSLSTINAMILDRNDSLERASVVNYLPLLAQPHPSTPKFPGSKVFSVSASGTLGSAASDTFVSGAGDHWIDGGGGVDTVLYPGRAAGYRLAFVGSGIQVDDKAGLEGRDTLTNVERLQFADRSIQIETRAHGGFRDIPPSMYQFFILAFGAAPGVEYLQQCADAYRGGADVKRITNVFTSKSQFTDIYPTSLGKRELATKLVANVVGDSATQAAKDEAINDITLAMNNGLGVGDMIFTVFSNLATKTGDAKWGGTAQLFFNQIAVAKYYTEVLNQSTTDRATLASAISMVKADSDVSTEAAIVTLIGQGLLGG